MAGWFIKLGKTLRGTKVLYNGEELSDIKYLVIEAGASGVTAVLQIKPNRIDLPEFADDEIEVVEVE